MKQQSITSLPASPDAERRSRMIKYSVTMGIRVVCLVLMLFAQGWWLVVFAVGAIVLPYVAVVFANVGSKESTAEVLRPGGIIRVDQSGYAHSESAQEVADDESDDGSGRPEA